jgi:hypothetical protein
MDVQGARITAMATALADRYGTDAICVARRQTVGATEEVARAWEAIIALL